MNKSLLNIISIGYAKRALETGTREQERMKLYSSAVEQMHIIVFTKKSEKFPDLQQIGNLFLYATNSRTNFGKISSAIRIGKKIISDAEGIDWVVSSQDPFETSLVGSAIASGDRTTHQIQLHGDMFNPFNSGSSLIQIARSLYAKNVVVTADKVRVVSERIKKSLIRVGVDESKITVLPIQTDLQEFIEVGKNRPYDKKTNNIKFLYVGRFAEEKNPSLIIKSFASIASDFKNSSLTMLGEGPLQEDLETLISKLDLNNRIKIHSWTDSVSEVMSEHDILCLSSKHEGWGMVLLEASASGMAIVTTDVGCVGERIKNNVHGLVVKVGDETGFSRAMQEYLTDNELMKKHSQAGHLMAKESVLSQERYLERMVDSWSSSTGQKIAIL